jgi:hypothetical protein
VTEQGQTTLGSDFAHAFAAKDGDRIRELVHHEIDFRGLTPNRNCEAGDPESLVSDSFADRERVGYSGFRPI